MYVSGDVELQKIKLVYMPLCHETGDRYLQDYYTVHCTQERYGSQTHDYIGTHEKMNTLGHSKLDLVSHPPILKNKNKKQTKQKQKHEGIAIIHYLTFFWQFLLLELSFYYSPYTPYRFLIIKNLNSIHLSPLGINK